MTGGNRDVIVLYNGVSGCWRARESIERSISNGGCPREWDPVDIISLAYQISVCDEGD